MTTPIFIFSLPRSGSTLLQRILSTHSEIATISEPWLLLPFYYVLEERSVYAEYGHLTTHRAFKNVISNLPNGIEDYYASVQNFAHDIYQKLNTGGAHYFLDKTPRYHLIASHIIRTFPSAKFIFLWRHPLAVVASLMTLSSEKGTWKDLHRYSIDLFKGFDNLFQSFTAYGDRCISICYEDLIQSPQDTLSRLEEYLEIEFPGDALGNFMLSNLKGELGDKRGGEIYKGISVDSLDRWKKIFNTYPRKKWALAYIKWLGLDRLNTMGYNLNNIMNEIDGVNPSLFWSLPDFFEMIFYEKAYAVLDPTIIKYKIRQKMNGQRTYPLF